VGELRGGKNTGGGKTRNLRSTTPDGSHERGKGKRGWVVEEGGEHEEL